MIGYVKGIVTYIFEEYCYLEAQGLGYRIFISPHTGSQLEIGREAVLFTHLSIREDAHILYGFPSKEEYDLFVKLVAVSGVGPKVALGILASLRPQDFILAIANQDISALTSISGIGKKTAERLLLEMKDKIILPENFSMATLTGNKNAKVVDNVNQEVLDALLGLGYHTAEVMPKIKQFAQENQPVEVILKKILRELAAGR